MIIRNALRIPVICALLFSFTGFSIGQTQQDKKGKSGDRFFQPDTIHTVRIYFNQCNYWDSLTFYKKRSDSLQVNHYMQVNVMINGKMKFACGIRFKGESSYEFYPGVKKSFRIKFDKFIKGQDLDGIDDLNLTNNFRDPTMIREKIYLDLMAKYNLPAPRASFIKVYVNDKYWGLYLATEQIDKRFIKRQFGESSGHLYQGEPLANLVDYGNNPMAYFTKYRLQGGDEKSDWSDLIRYIKLINDTSGTELDYQKRLEFKMDLHKLLKAWAINNLIGNVDSYNMFYPHNFFLYRDSSNNRWHWISQDGNYSFAGWNPLLNYNQLLRMDIMVPDSTPYQDERPLLSKTLGRNKLIQKQYLLYLKEIFENDFQPEVMNQRIDSYARKIRFSVYADSNKMYSNSDFDANLTSTIGDPMDPGNFIPGLKDYVRERAKYIEDQLQSMLKKLE